MKKTKRALLFPLTLLPLVVTAGGPPRKIIEDFTTYRAAADSTAVWNLVGKRLHLPYVVDRSADDTVFTAIGPENDALDLGDGSDGAFNADTMGNFDADPSDGNRITLNTARVYQFTSFELPAAVVLTGAGNAPLQIRVQGDVTIRGSVNLSGGPGDPGLDSSSPFIAMIPQGGTACCGGGRGGNGGSALDPPGTPAEDGIGAAANGQGLRGGSTADSATPVYASGGGGAAHSSNGQNGATRLGGVPPTAGAGGTSYGNTFLAPLYGGSGGGGGGAHMEPGLWRDSGGGGGGGGGALVVHAGGTLHITASGDVLTNGGAGGGVANNVTGAGGGGGSGGAVLIFAAGPLINDGIIRALGGAKGAGLNGPDGGDGSDGRLRYTSGEGEIDGTGNENPPFAAPNFGRIFFARNANYTIVSRVIDSGNSAPSYISIEKTQNTPAGTSLTYEVAGSSDGFESDDTGFLPEAQLANLKGKRFFRYRITLHTTDRRVTPEVTRLQFNLEDRVQPDFSFGLASCAGASPQGAGSPLGALILLGVLILVPLGLRRGRVES